MSDFVTIDGVRLEWTWHGPGADRAPTMVFLHEGLGSISQWRDFPATLSARTGCGALVYNRRGYGASDPIDRPHPVRFLHDEALVVLPRVLDTFGIRRPILVGHSDGASIALIYAGSSAAAAPRALLLEAPHVFVEDITVTEIAAMCERYSTTNLRTRLARHHSHVDTLFQRWTDIWLDPQFRGWNIDACLPRVGCPVLVVQGRNDQHGTASQVIAVMGGVRGRSESVMLGNCRHSPHRDQRVLVELLMTRFIRANGTQIEDRTSSGV